MAILGVGSIGREVARRAAVFSIRVIGIDPVVTVGEDPIEGVFPPGETIDTLREADILLVSCPLTAETESLIGREVQCISDKCIFVRPGGARS